MAMPTVRRGSYKAKLTNFSKYLDELKTKQSVTDVDLFQLEDRLKKISSLLDKFDDVQISIEETAEDAAAEAQERATFEDNFFTLTALAKKILKDYKPESPRSRASSVASEQSNNREDGELVSNGFSSQHIKLPTIELPKFDGSYSSWLDFRDTYESLIHQNVGINDIQKFHYLRAAATGGAAQVISSLEFTARNYSVAWGALLERYDNRRLLVHNHVKALFGIESMQKESASGLRIVMDSVSKNLRALEQLQEPTHNWDTLVVYIVSSKFDSLTLREWENYKSGREVPTLEDLKNFIKSRADLLETLQACQRERAADKKHGVRGFLSTENRNGANSSVIKCKLCKRQHYIQNCSEFLQLAHNHKIEKLQALNLCQNCLRPGHSKDSCRRGTCRKCSAKHHTLLHVEKSDEKPLQQNNANVSTTSANANSIVLSAGTSATHVLLSTAYVQAQDRDKNLHTIRALLDSGSQANYITKKLSDRLKLDTTREQITILGVNNSVSNIEKKCDISIQALHNNFAANITCFVVPEITGCMPSVPVNVSELKIPKNLKLADPSFHSPQRIDMLIGAQLFWQLICIGQISLGKNNPILQKTRLGWIVSGSVGKSETSTVLCNFNRQSESDIQAQLSRFWELEECGPVRSLSQEEIACELHFSENTKRAVDGRFIVKMPLKDPIEKLGDSYAVAERRFLALERKLNSNPDLKIKYSDFMSEYQSLGHMAKVSTPDTAKIAYYMPHKAVVREDRLSSKIRVVFDASAPSSSGYSLNHLQMTGPTIQNELISILMRFRQHKYVVAGDVEKMYRQIQISPEQRSLQRILWREDSRSPLGIFELGTVTYGTTSGSYLAVRCLYELAQENKFEYPLFAQVIENDFYIDDMLTGADSIEEAAQIAKGVADILEKGCFKLRKFYSNDREVLKYVVEEDCPIKIIEFGINESAKTLGLSWCPESDKLMYRISEAAEFQRVSKRSILSSISQIFDPLGLLSPCIINTKILLQQLWLEKVTWDETLPAQIHTFWCEFRHELVKLNELRIDRHVVVENPEEVEMHCFSDASEKAFGGCIYLRSMDKTGKISVRLLCAKSKVAPLKTITLPRLELSGALTVARLADKVGKSLRLKIHKRTFWSDSTIVLGWLKLPPNKLKTFVSNRVAEVQEITSYDRWYHIRGKDNPADLLTRGVKPNNIIGLDLWWHGPAWLSQQSTNWPPSKSLQADAQPDLPDVRKNTLVFVSENAEPFPFHRFSKLHKVKRVTAYILRFISNCRAKRENRMVGPLTLTEIKAAFTKLIKSAQKNSFSQEIGSLQSERQISSKSRLLSLHPFLDEEGILRVGGRLQNSNYNIDKKNPIVLCSKHRLTLLIFESEHLRLLHPGPQQLLAAVREKFWPILGRNLSKSVVRHCITCFRVKPKTLNPIMGQLPLTRLQPSPPFSITGVDYAGPLQIKDRRGRGGRLGKA